MDTVHSLIKIQHMNVFNSEQMDTVCSLIKIQHMNVFNSE